MHRKNIVNLIMVLVLFGFAIWVLLPIDSTRLGREGLSLGLDLKGGTQLIYQADLSQRDPSMTENQAMEATMQKIEMRIMHAFGGITEPIVQKQGTDRILVQIPGIRDVNKATELIGATAQLNFREYQYNEKGEPVLDEDGMPIWVVATAVGSDGETRELTGSYLKSAVPGLRPPPENAPLVSLEFNKEGAELFEQITLQNWHKPLGIFVDDNAISTPVVLPDEQVRKGISGGKASISGGDMTLDEAKMLAVQLNSGALNAPLSIIKQQDVDPTLGKDSIDKSLIAGIIGIILLLIFMTAYYRLPGFLACCALVIYGSLVLMVFKLYPVTLTLPGIAAFLLSLGMAVDANVLIFERMKEELRTGRTLGASIERGFNRAWTAIRDSNVSTFIICGILWWLGDMLAEPRIVGFAQTLIIGVALSMFSAIIITRTFLRLFPGTRLGNKSSLFKV
ncbi:MAG: protein translocase subunit SecD [Dehalococcoidia bacterium]|nr:protein translocase subunit SecD [Dehalococcoidia bacterium]